MSFYLAHMVNLMSVYVILAASLNLVAGFGGMLSAAHVSIYGLGAYALAYATTVLGWTFLQGMCFVLPLAMGASYLIGRVCARMSGDFFLLATLAWHLLLATVYSNWIAVTGGPYGMSGIPSPGIVGLTIGGHVGKAAFAAAAATVAILLIGTLIRSPFGRCLQAVRDDAVAAAASGKDAVGIRQQAFLVSGTFAALAGAIYASAIGYVDPHAFAMDELVFLLAAVVVGGAGHTRGPVIGILILFLIPEALRLLPLPPAAAANVRQVLFGALLLLVMRVRPNGVAGRYAFD